MTAVHSFLHCSLHTTGMSHLKIGKCISLIFGGNFMVTCIFSPIVNSRSTQFLFKKLDLHPFFPKICVKQVHVSIVRL